MKYTNFQQFRTKHNISQDRWWEDEDEYTKCMVWCWCLFCSNPELGQKNPDVCLPVYDQPKISENKGQGFFFFFPFYSQFCIFKQNCSNKMSEYVVTVPKRYLNQI